MAKKKSTVETPAPATDAAATPSPSPESRTDDTPVQVKTHPRLEDRQNYIEQLAARSAPDFEAAPEEPPAETPPVSEPPPEAAPAKTRKLKVDGEEKDVEEDRIIEAGIRALQKESAADKRLQEATEKLTRAEQLLTAAQKTPPTGDNPDDEPPPPSSPDADVDALARAIQFGTEAEVKAAVKTMLDRRGSGRDDATPKPEDVVAVVEQRLEFKSALTKFQADFKDVWDDPYLRKLAFDEDDKLTREIAAGQREPMTYLERFAEAGKAVRTWREKIAAPAGTPRVELGADKQANKAAAGSIPTAGGRASPPPPAAPASTADIVREMRAARGQL